VPTEVAFEQFVLDFVRRTVRNKPETARYEQIPPQADLVALTGVGLACN
jgi:hypothetical protein